MYVANVPYGCCKKVDLDVAYVAMAIHVCCKCLLKMFHLLQTYVASVFIWMLHMLQWLCVYVLVAIHICCKPMFQIFHLLRRMLHEVLSCCKCFMSRRRRSLCAWYGYCKSRFRCRICCNGYTRMLQVSIQNVSSTSDICCKCFYLDVAYVVVGIHIRC